MTISHTGHNCLHGAAGAGAVGGGWGIHHVTAPHINVPHVDPGHHVGNIPHVVSDRVGLAAYSEPLHVFSLQAISLPGGITLSLVALVAISCLAIILASTLVKKVVVRCST
jgi:hypothetical protein